MILYKFILKHIKTIPFLLCFFALLSSNIAQNSICEQATMLTKTADKFHYQPRPLDDKFSELVYNKFLQLLDINHEYLTNEDIQQLESYKLEIDDNIKNQDCSLKAIASSIYRKRLLVTDSIIESYRNFKFDFALMDTLVRSDSNNYLKENQIANYWKRIIKFRILSQYFAVNESTSENLSPSFEDLTEIREAIINRKQYKIRSILKKLDEEENYIGILYLKSIASSYDPHTNYFTIDDEKRFEKMLSENTLSFGFDVYLNDYGELEVYKITPGGPAWNSSEINIGDIILNFSGNEFSDTTKNCLAIDQFYSLSDSENIIEARFRIRKKNKKENTITLKKLKIDIEENVIKSFILNGKRKIGYIYLPIFYSKSKEFNSLTNGCADDLAKTLIKLKKENIEGLILDIRNNGGGLMLEASQIAGIFIDYGALGIFHVKNELPQTMKDINRGTIYNDPLLIMINSYSASASEFFAAAIQDHNRGIIVGSKSFGKSTAQIVLPIDAYKTKHEFDTSNPNKAFVKLTTGAFYRVNGESHQACGIIPDIEIPGIFQYNESSEKQFPSVLKLEKIIKKTYYYPLKEIPVNELQILSSNRISTDTVFKNMLNISDYILDHKENHNIPLDIVSFSKASNSIKTMLDKFDTATLVTNTLYSVIYPNYMTSINNMIKQNETIKDTPLIGISNDIYIKESYSIILDLIDLTK